MKRMPKIILGLLAGLHAIFNAFAIEPGSPSVMSARRDPFEMGQTSKCQTAVTDEGIMLSKWQLRGIIGLESNLRGWIQFPTGEWLKVFSQAKLPLTHWQLNKIYSDAVLFSPQFIDEASCHSTKIIELKMRK